MARLRSLMPVIIAIGAVSVLLVALLYGAIGFMKQQPSPNPGLTPSPEPVPIQQPNEPIYYKNKVNVLMYHHLEVNPTKDSIITPQLLDEQLDALLKSGFEIITMDQYVDFMLHGKQVPDNAVLLTFDDGYSSFYELAYPVFAKHKVAATSFVMAGTIENDKHHGYKKLTWDQMREMMRDGHRFMNHTYDSHQYAPIDAQGHTRPMLAGKLYLKQEKRVETADEYIRRISTDLRESEKLLRDQLGNTYGVLAFPYGVYNKEVLQAAEEAGIELFLTIKPGINTSQQKVGFRINAGNKKMTPAKLIESLKQTASEAEPGIQTMN